MKKFRAWDNDNKKYFKPTYEAFNGKIEELNIGLSGDLHIRTFTESIHESCFPGRFIIEQFTGLTDSEGKEIYEGDIVSWKYGIDIVVFQDAGFAPFAMPGDSEPNPGPGDVKIIGTIHTHPELLEQSNE